MSKNVVFLDRDGVINRDSPDFIKSWAEFEFLPGSLEALRFLTAEGLTLVVITNQSGIGRGLITNEALAEMHMRMLAAVEDHGGHILDILFCPHTPQAGCDCRKPKPGLLHEAQKRHGLDLSRAVMVGDSATDIQCAQNGGCAKSILVRSGDDTAAREALAAKGLKADHTANDLRMAAKWIIANLDKT